MPIGVRYPQEAQDRLQEAGIEYRGWLPNYKVPEVFARHRVTIHIPRRPYRESIPGVPTIRVFEALACGIPLGLRCIGRTSKTSFIPAGIISLAQTGEEMADHLQCLLENPERAAELAEHGRNTILQRHTCAHRVDELLDILAELKNESPTAQVVTGTKS